MSKNLVHITTQYHENYSDNNVPHWKPKGSHTFSLVMDADILLYAQELAIKAIQMLLDAHSNEYCKYTYVAHEVFFHDITPLSETAFEVAFEQVTGIENTPQAERSEFNGYVDLN